MEIEIFSSSNLKPLLKCKVQSGSSVAYIKQEIFKARKIAVNRQAIRLEARGKPLNDHDTIEKLNISKGDKLYCKDLGPQIGWKTVFLAEYAGPLAVYLWIYQRPWPLYSTDSSSIISNTSHVAAACWTIHYAKRLLETIFVHRFSHQTMPFRNLFKNCSYYWGFTAYVAYHVNHPLYTPPCTMQMYLGLLGFLLCEYGNFSIHVNLRNLRPPGTKIRKIPKPDGNPFTSLLNYVSCPNYTYEVGAWLFFSIMTNCIPAFIFALAGFIQMAVWAIAKHRNYKKEFNDYPKKRKSILPFLL